VWAFFREGVRKAKKIKINSWNKNLPQNELEEINEQKEEQKKSKGRMVL